MGIYEHFYEDSVFGPAPHAPDTHYVVLGYQLNLLADVVLDLPEAQHSHYRWWPISDMQHNRDVHDNTRAYLDALR